MFTMQARNRAQAVRARPTSNEALLWSRLRNRKLAGLKFRRQVPIEGYIADFLCIEARLIVEADGPTHVGNAYDQERDRQLEAIGYLVLRFSNARIWNHFEAVLADIQSAAGR